MLMQLASFAAVFAILAFIFGGHPVDRNLIMTAVFVAVSVVLIYAGVIAAQGLPKYSHVFIMGVLCNFIIWLKVSTDLFPFLSLFAALAFLTSDIEFLKQLREEEETEEESDNGVPVPE